MANHDGFMFEERIITNRHKLNIFLELAVCLGLLLSKIPSRES